MDLASLIGLVVGTLLLVGIMQFTGGILLYWDLTSIIIVLGGSFFATMARFSLSTFIKGLSAGLKAVHNNLQDDAELIEEIIECAQIARKESILALEKFPVKNQYFAKAVRCMVDGYDPELIRALLDLEIMNLKKRHKIGNDIFNYLGEACPAFGMIGTVIGLIVIMANLSDPSKIGPGLAVALVTTLYGSLLANMYFIPVTSKLEFNSRAEVQNLEIIKVGVDALLAGENPKIIRSKLGSFLGEKDN